MNFLSNLKIFKILVKSLNLTYMVLYMHSIPLHLTCLCIKLKKNLVLRAKLSNFFIYYAKETKRNTLFLF